jgi:hypothetical protein
MNVQHIENLLLNHQLRFPNDTAITEAAHVVEEAMFHSVRTHMEQGLINIVWKHFNSLEVTEDDLEVIPTFNHWFELNFEEVQEETFRYLDSQEQISQHDVFEAFEQLQDQLPHHEDLAIQAYQALGEFILTDDERDVLNVLCKLTTPGLHVSDEDIEAVQPLSVV